ALHAREPGFRLKPQAVKARLAEESERYGLAVDPSARVSDLSIGEWQRVELLKVLLTGARVLILDEPTSVLTPQEVDGLFTVVRRLRDEGVGVVIINHKMREVREIADRVTVLRGGKAIVTDVLLSDLSDDELVTAMVGESVTPVSNEDAGEEDATAPVLVARDLRLKPVGDGSGLQGVDLSVAAGEILGVAGVAGNGQQELTDLLTGTAEGGSGEVLVDGVSLPLGDPKKFHAAGVVPVVADPVQQFVVPGLTVGEHAALWRSSGTDKRLRFEFKAARRQLAEASDRVELRVASADRRLADLSGGNIQRVVLALALSEPSKVLVVSYPTRGLDVRTTEVTRSLLLAAREAGAAVVLVSEDLDELLALSDRIAVLAKGRLAGIVPRAGAHRQQLGQLMTGGTP
ncbi:MAG TPA: ATP-binding cassette domain-containing protein, partial [Acidimicrobiales bacterium]